MEHIVDQNKKKKIENKMTKKHKLIRLIYILHKIFKLIGIWGGIAHIFSYTILLYVLHIDIYNRPLEDSILNTAYIMVGLFVLSGCLKVIYMNLLYAKIIFNTDEKIEIEKNEMIISYSPKEKKRGLVKTIIRMDIEEIRNIVYDESVDELMFFGEFYREQHIKKNKQIHVRTDAVYYVYINDYFEPGLLDTMEFLGLQKKIKLK